MWVRALLRRAKVGFDFEFASREVLTSSSLNRTQERATFVVLPRLVELRSRSRLARSRGPAGLHGLTLGDGAAELDGWPALYIKLAIVHISARHTAQQSNPTLLGRAIKLCNQQHQLRPGRQACISRDPQEPLSPSAPATSSLRSPRMPTNPVYLVGGWPGRSRQRCACVGGRTPRAQPAALHTLDRRSRRPPWLSTHAAIAAVAAAGAAAAAAAAAVAVAVAIESSSTQQHGFGS